MLFYLLIIIIIIILLFIPNKYQKKEKDDFKVFDIQRDVLSKTGDLAKYLILK